MAHLAAFQPEIELELHLQACYKLSVVIVTHLRLVTMLKMGKSIKEQVLQLVRKAGVLRPRDLDAQGIPREYLTRLCAEGRLEHPGRGIYVLAGVEPGNHQSLVEVCKRVPRGVVCLLSALRFQELTTQEPFQVWLAISTKARLPKVDYPPLRIVRFSGSALKTGIEKHILQGVPVTITVPAFTVVDCFKYRNKIGLDVAIEALRDCWRQKKATMDDLHRAAQTRRMVNVMRPYLESLV
jgi:predicted transcriptional regulator of viral defense system